LEHDGKLVVVRKGKDIFISAIEHGHGLIAGTFIDLKAVRQALERGGWVSLETDRKHIAVDPEWLSGRPTVRGHRIATETVAELATREEGMDLLRADFGLTEEEISEAVSYEEDVRKAVAA
jgi:uncharacterized protein (DUF433 family)